VNEPYVVVIGGANMDLHAQARTELLPGTSNPGTSQLSPGGVGRNVAEVIARLGTACHLVSVVGDDPLGVELLAHTEEAGVDVTQVRQRQGVLTGTYAAILDPAGELMVAVADMAATDLITPLVVEAAASLIRGASVLVLDGNLLQATIEHALAIAVEAGIRVVLDPVSVPKSVRLRPVLGPGIDLITPNRAELAAFTGLPTRTEAEIEAAIEHVRALGVLAVWVGMGREGSLLIGPSGRHRLPAVVVEPVDVTGAGDAMVGAFCHASLRGESRPDAARYGQAAAALTVTSRSTVRTDLSDELIRSIL